MKTNKNFSWLLAMITLLVCLLAALDAVAANSLTDAQIRERTRAAFDPSNSPPDSIQASNITITGTATIPGVVTNGNAQTANLTVTTNATVAGTLGVTGLTTLGALSNTTLRVSGTGTIGTANVGTLTLSTVKTGAVPYTVTIGEAIAPDGSTNKTFILTP